MHGNLCYKPDLDDMPCGDGDVNRGVVIPRFNAAREKPMWETSPGRLKNGICMHRMYFSTSRMLLRKPRTAYESCTV